MIGNFLALATYLAAILAVVAALALAVDFVMTRYYRGNPLPLIAFIVVLILLVASYVLTANGYRLISGL